MRSSARSVAGLVSLGPSMLGISGLLDQTQDVVLSDNMIGAAFKDGMHHFLRAVAYRIDKNIESSDSDLLSSIQRLDIAIQLSKKTESVRSLEKAVFYCVRGTAALCLDLQGSGSHLDGAIADFKKSVELNPVHQAYFLLGKAYMHADKAEKAIESFAKAIELDCAYAEAYLLKGLLHKALGEEDDAHENIYWAISLNPDFYEEQFEPIMQAERESETLWDDLRSQPEFDAMLQDLENDL